MKGFYTLELKITGSPASGEYPRMVVSVDGKKAKEFTIQTENMTNPKNFVVPIRIAKGGKRTITFEFTNDKMIEGKTESQQKTNIANYDLKITGQKRRTDCGIAIA